MSDRLETDPLDVPLAELVDAPQVQSPRPDVPNPHKVRRRRRPLILFVLCLGTTLGIVYLALPTPKYTASALLQVRSAQPRVLFATSEPLRDYESYRRTQVQHIKGRSVLKTALRNPNVANLPLIQNLTDPGVVDRLEVPQISWSRG
jgi:uncharacterized protein involved in exopolysaccharide biosynthesis